MKMVDAELILATLTKRLEIALEVVYSRGIDPDKWIAEIQYLGPDSTEANAHLIAAAPELLDACERLKNFLILNPDSLAKCHRETLDLMNQAIAKATGGES